jgi:hypothetical protein
MNHKRVSIIVATLYLSFVVSTGFTQKIFTKDSTRLYFLGAKLQRGFMLRDNKKLDSLELKKPFMFQLDFSVLKNEQRTWDYCGCFIENGASISYINFGNEKSLGHSINLTLFTEPYLVWSKKIQLTLRAGAGLAYVNKIYNAETNPLNVACSKHVSFLLSVNPNLYYVVGERTRLSFGAQFNHISNGGSRWPNWGLNMVTFNIGAGYSFNTQTLKKKNTTPITNRSIRLITHIFGGRHNSDPDGQFVQKKRMVGGLNIGVVKPLGRINALGVGGELYYDGLGKVLEAQHSENYHLFIGSVSLQHYFFFGNFCSANS